MTLNNAWVVDWVLHTVLTSCALILCGIQLWWDFTRSRENPLSVKSRSFRFSRNIHVVAALALASTIPKNLIGPAVVEVGTAKRVVTALGASLQTAFVILGGMMLAEETFCLEARSPNAKPGSLQKAQDSTTKILSRFSVGRVCAPLINGILNCVFSTLVVSIWKVLCIIKSRPTC